MATGAFSTIAERKPFIWRKARSFSRCSVRSTTVETMKRTCPAASRTTEELARTASSEPSLRTMRASKLGDGSPPARIAPSLFSSSATSDCGTNAWNGWPSMAWRGRPIISARARFTNRTTPSGPITTRPTGVRSNASRISSTSMRGGSLAIALMAPRLMDPERRARRRFHRRAPQRRAQLRAEALGKLLEHVVLGRVVDHLLGLDHLARDVLEAAQPVGEAQLHALLPGPDEPGEHLGRLLQALAAPLAHHGDELPVDLVQHLLGMLPVRRLLRKEGIEEVLVVARVIGAPLDAELVERAGEAEAADDDADGADQARLVDVDPVGRGRDVIAAGGAQVLHHHEERSVRIFRAQAADLVVDVARLHGAAAGAVDAQHDTLRVGVLERPVQALDDLLGRSLRLRGDHAFEVHERRVLADARAHRILVRAPDPSHPCGQDEEREDEPEQLEERAPLAPAALLFEGPEGDFFENRALPQGRAGIGHGFSFRRKT